MTTVNVRAWVDVDVDLDEVDDDDLLDEVRRRGFNVWKGSEQIEDADERMTEMFYAFKLGKTERAIELAKGIARDHTGRIL